MQLAHIDFDKLSISTLNMRHGKRAPDISDILPSIRARGVLVPLLVRPNGGPDSFEIVAGRRRYFSAKAVKEEQGECPPLPCAIMESGDDAAALEASLIENIARLDPDEMSQYETFARLLKKGRTIPEIAITFGIADVMVKQRLALGNLHPRIREAYRAEEIDPETIRHLTLASKAQQKDWLALFADENGSAPHGSDLKHWLFGGQSVSTKVALFPLENYPGQIVSDLFGEEQYFADVNLFWQRQNAEIAGKRERLLEAGWKDVVVLAQGERFHSWEHEKMPKKKGGKVFIAVSPRGEVELHEGYLSRKEAAKAKRNGGSEVDSTPAKPGRPEVTSTLQTYIDLHRHAAVRLSLLDHPGVALRLMIAHAVAGSGLWQVTPEPQQTRTEAVAASVAGSASEVAFNTRRAGVQTLLGLAEDGTTVTQGHGDSYQTTAIFARLLALGDNDVLKVLSIVMGETLQAGGAMVEVVGVHLKVDMGEVWQPDDAFFDLMRDRQVLNAMLAEVAGKAVADGNVAEKAKTQKQIIRDCLDGTNGRSQVESWLPGWMAFPVRSLTERGGFRTAEDWARVRNLIQVG